MPFPPEITPADTPLNADSSRNDSDVASGASDARSADAVPVRVRRLVGADGLELPSYRTPGAAGLDVCAAEDRTIAPGERALVPTGLAIELPRGFEAQMRPRSGLALEHGVTLLNAPGTIDADYRGEIGVILINHGHAPFFVRRGERIAQMVIARHEIARLEEVEELSSSKRGAGGFGHTGVATGTNESNGG